MNYRVSKTNIVQIIEFLNTLAFNESDKFIHKTGTIVADDNPNHIIYWIKFNIYAINTREVYKWSIENLQSQFKIGNSYIYFTDKSDYVMFMLRWSQ